MNEIASVLAVICALGITSAFIPSWINVCHKWHLFESPDERKHHKRSTPSMGGMGIYAGFIISFLLITSSLSLPGIKFIMIASMLLFFTGFFDDLLSMSAVSKILFQVVAAALIAYGDTRITDMHGFLGLHEIPLWLQYVVTISVVVFITNAYNLIDGVDGLAASLAIIACGISGLVFLSFGKMELALICFCLGGAVTGFLLHNFHPAKIFMGDTGSLVIGFLIAAVCIELSSIKDASGNFAVPAAFILAIIFIPVYDVLRVSVIRMITGHSPLRADRRHIHHMMMKQGFGHRMVTFIVLMFNAFFIGMHFIFPQMNINLFFMMCICLGMITINSRMMFIVAVVYKHLGGKLFQKKKAMQNILRKAA